MKRCKHCGREGKGLRPVVTPFGLIAGWECNRPAACIKRMEQRDRWVGKRVLRRTDADGTRWTIRPHTDGYELTCEYREHRLTSRHSTVKAAMAYRDEVVDSLVCRTMREYTGRSI